MSDTPRTDACIEARKILRAKYGGTDGVGEEFDAGNLWKLAANLERELRALRPEGRTLEQMNRDRNDAIDAARYRLARRQPFRLIDLRDEEALDEALRSTGPQEGSTNK